MHAEDLSPDTVDQDLSEVPGHYFSEVLAQYSNRRAVLRGGLQAAVAVSFSGVLAACGSDNNPQAMAPELKVSSVARSLEDALVLPPEYQASVLFATGDRLNAEGGDKPLEAITGAEMATRAGDHHDGMYFYGLDSTGQLSRNASDRGLLAINFENINQQFLHVNGASADSSGRRTVADEVLKEINAHGVGILEIAKRSDGRFEPVASSRFARRVTPETLMRITGPVAGSAWVKTKFSPDGMNCRGTLNNCAYGYTPWGTYLTCEENWAGYFDNSAAATTAAESRRYGINANQRGSYRWATAGTEDRFARWQLAPITEAPADGSGDYRNEANTFGWVVEIDPLNPSSTPVKRSTFGRMAHECAYPSPIKDGKRMAFYQGDDARFEYIYKFVPTLPWSASDARLGAAAGDKYLDQGTLYVAKLNADGSGEWIALQAGQGPLTPENGFADQAAVLVKTRSAADAVGATKMDRPEWVTVDPNSGEIYCTLTNNSNRGVGSNPGTDAANPRAANVGGHIIRMRERDDDPAALSFKWTIFVFGSAATNEVSNLSGLTAENDFASPDGIWMDPRGLLWIQSDNGHANEMGRLCNNQMLVTLPPADFSAKPVIRRFLVGPKECEITGVDITPDGKTMFLNVQHPGEETTVANLSNPTSSWPYDRADATRMGSKGARPRSATVVITRKDGGVIGF